MAGVTLDDCVRQFSLSVELLDSAVSGEDIQEVSKFLQWRRVAPYLELNQSEFEEIDSDGKNEQEKRRNTLLKWKGKFAFKATYKKLIMALLESGRADHAEEVCKLLAPEKGE